MKRVRSEVDPEMGIIGNLRRREVSTKSNRLMVKHSSYERFKNVGLQYTMDTHDPDSPLWKHT
jgi:hypothetical protein